MSIIGSNVLAGASGQAGAAAYEIEQSLRFNDDDTAHFDRTPSSVGARATWTYSVWVKGSEFSGDANTLLSGGNYAYGTYLWFRDGGHIALGRYHSGSYTFLVEADGFYRDPTAWYHIVCVFDSSQATASDRVKLYVNGEQITSFTTANYPSSNFETDINNDGIQWIGERGYDSGLKLHGYLAEAHLVDGSPLEPTSFGEYDENGVWRPIEVALTGPNDGTTWSDYLTDSNGFDSSYPATKAFNGTTDSANTARATTTNTTATFEPPTDIPYTSSVEVWTYYSGSVSLNGGSAVSVSNDQAWRTIATGSGSLDTLAFTSSSSTVYLGAIRIDGVVLIDGNSHQYGKNGFYLKFDPTATNGIGHDHSGNGNNWNPNNFTTSGTGTDVMSDTPTTNWCTLNPLEAPGNDAISDGNLAFSTSDADHAISTIGAPSGKFYCEATCGGANAFFGLVNNTGTRLAYNGSTTLFAIANDGNEYSPNSTRSFDSFGTFTTGDIISFALDATNESCDVYQNGTKILTYDTFTLDGPYFFAFDRNSASPTVSHTVNFGQREFAYPPGTVSATDYFNTVTYTGDGGTQSVTGVGFQPDLVWIKSRSLTIDHVLQDSVRGVSAWLSPNLPNGENTDTDQDYFRSFDSDGFTVSTSGTGAGSGVEEWNKSGATYVAWCWKAGGTASSNTDGTINSSVSANNDAGFSVVTFTGTGTAGTVGHGLDTAPGVVMLKKRSGGTMGAGYSDWLVQLTSNGNVNQYVSLNSTSAFSESSSVFGAHPTSSVFSVGNNQISNNSGSLFVAYCWADKDGVTKTGSYTGTGTQGGGLYVECGFKPAMVIVKGDATASWQIIDNKRGDDVALFPDSTSLENERSDRQILFVQSGFLVQGNDGNINSSGVNYHFIAFASNLAVDADYKALNTANLPAPDIADGSDYFNTILWAGDNANPRTLTGVGFQPDWVWLKDRTQSTNHRLVDAVRGAGNTLKSNNTSSETSSEVAGTITAFTSDGFTVEGTSTVEGVNLSGDNFVAWNWLAGGSGSSNTDGSITSTVSANPTAGFSIVSYTGNNTAGATVGHGLGVAPDLIITKNRDNSSAYWATFHHSSGTSKKLYLNDPQAPDTASGWIGVSSTLITWNQNNANNVNENGSDFICYCFAEVEGYSKFGSYAGNGSSNGPFVYTGFKPAWLMVKKDASSTEWKIYDAGREPYNVISARLAANTSASELSGNAQEIDFVSNGFKFRGTNGDQNSSGTFYYVAFASNPFGGSGVSPATAR